MSLHAAEKALWLIGNQEPEARRFSNDRQAYLQGFVLDEREREWLETLDVRRLSDHGVNPLLLLGAYRAIKGPDSVPEYMQRMNSP